MVAETGSTNADLAQAARDGAGEGAVLIAESQRAGRGRLDRDLARPAAFGHHDERAVATGGPGSAGSGWLPLLAGVALAEAVDRVAGVDAALKWPNDLLVRATQQTAREYGKAAGILGEAVAGDPVGVVIGIGLNVSQRADELPPPSDPRAYPPTSIGLARRRDRPGAVAAGDVAGH